MAQNAYEVLSETHTSLMKHLDTNHDVCEFLMAFYKHIQEVANESPNDPKNLICKVDIVMERLLKISCSYYPSGERNSLGQSKLPANRNQNIVELFQVNHNIRDVALNVANIIDKWIAEKPERKQQGFSSLKLINAKHWTDHTFTAELVVKFEFEDYVTAATKYDVNAPEQLTEEETKIEEQTEQLAEKFQGSDLEWRKGK